MPQEQERYMKEALVLAREAAAAGEVPVGCVIVRDGQIVGRGRNRREEKHATASHAEMEAIAQANRDAGDLAAGGVRAVCDAGAVPHVCRGGFKRPHRPRVVWRPGRGHGGLRRRDQLVHGVLSQSAGAGGRHFGRGMQAGTGGFFRSAAEEKRLT